MVAHTVASRRDYKWKYSLSEFVGLRSAVPSFGVVPCIDKLGNPRVVAEWQSRGTASESRSAAK